MWIATASAMFPKKTRKGNLSLKKAKFRMTNMSKCSAITILNDVKRELRSWRGINKQPLQHHVLNLPFKIQCLPLTYIKVKVKHKEIILNKLKIMAESYSGYVEMEPKMEDEKFSGFWEY